MTKFVKPFIPNPNILKAKPGNPLCYCTNDGMWAAIPCGKGFMIINAGNQIEYVNTYKQSRTYIKKQLKLEKDE